jgi:hypothetical protein
MHPSFDRKTMDYIGDISQIGGVKRYCFTTGKAKGMEALDVNNGAGLLFTVLPDRGMDIGHLSYKGMPVSFVSKAGIVAPWYYDGRGYEWLRSFTGGFLTTCGLTQVGDPCSFEGADQGLHGMVSNLPADGVNVFSDWDGDAYGIKVTGQVRQAKVQFENLLMKRTIETALGKDEIALEDEITNEGDRAEPFMLLYHINFGFPFLNPDCDIVLPAKKTTGWDDFSQKNADMCRIVTEPSPEPYDMTWYHELARDANETAGFMVANRKRQPDMAVAVTYNADVLDNFTQWRFLHKKDYVMSFEPCNNLVKGVEYERANGSLKYIQPGETVRTNLRFGFLYDPSDISERMIKMNES